MSNKRNKRQQRKELLKGTGVSLKDLIDRGELPEHYHLMSDQERREWHVARGDVVDGFADFMKRLNTDSDETNK